jgi:hypothetical protein
VLTASSLVPPEILASIAALNCSSSPPHINTLPYHCTHSSHLQSWRLQANRNLVP